MLFIFSLQYAIRKAQEINLALDKNGSQKVLTSVNLINEAISTRGRHADVLQRLAYNDISLSTNIGKINYLETDHHWGEVANEHVTAGNHSYLSRFSINKKWCL